MADALEPTCADGGAAAGAAVDDSAGLELCGAGGLSWSQLTNAKAPMSQRTPRESVTLEDGARVLVDLDLDRAVALLAA